MIRFLAKLQGIDPRWLYLVTAIVLIIPFVITMPLPLSRASFATRGVYDMIDSCPPDKVVMIDSSWHMGSQAENWAQLECVVKHLCKRGIKFIVTSIGIEPLAPEFARRVIEPIAREAGYEYGKDWVNCGYVQVGGQFGAVIKGLCTNFHNIYPKDYRGTKIEDLELMRRVRAAKDDVHVIYCVTYSPSPDWISYAKGQFGVPVAFAAMTIMAPSYCPFLDSGQLCGLLIGNSGAAEYEELIGERGKGSDLIQPASFGNCIIIAAAILGNIGLWAARANRRKAE